MSTYRTPKQIEDQRRREDRDLFALYHDPTEEMTAFGYMLRVEHEIVPPQITERPVPFTAARPDPIALDTAGHVNGRAIEIHYDPKE
jgi:hypothetical protein